MSGIEDANALVSNAGLRSSGDRSCASASWKRRGRYRSGITSFLGNIHRRFPTPQAAPSSKHRMSLPLTALTAANSHYQLMSCMSSNRSVVNGISATSLGSSESDLFSAVVWCGSSAERESPWHAERERPSSSQAVSRCEVRGAVGLICLFDLVGLGRV